LRGRNPANARAPEARERVRAQRAHRVHVDEADYLAGDWHGHGVHLAARIGAQAQGGELLISRETLEEVGPAITVGEPRTARLKGVSHPVELFPVIWT
jgi:class 3 adenylate cyclase